MATASAQPTTDSYVSASETQSWKRILLPYGLAILAQLPLLTLYFFDLWEKPHYQFFPFALIATIGLAAMRWPRNSKIPIHRSLTSDVLLVLGLIFGIAGTAFVEPAITIYSVVFLASSLLARTYDEETENSLWPCALPLFACLALPFDYANVIITRLQYYSAQFTSQLLDLIGLGHYLRGVVIELPGGNQYGIEEACSGVVSFFTLVAITAAFVVWKRRVTTPHPAATTLLILTGLILISIEYLMGGLSWLSLVAAGLILVAIIGFRAGLLMMSAVFWALFMNTVRIFLIPVADVKMGLDLVDGLPHMFLGYVVLLIGILLVLSTDQFLLFLFGSVEEADEQSAAFQKPITGFWNSFLWGGKRDEDARNRKKSRRTKERKTVTQTGRALIWTVAVILAACGAFQLVAAQQSYAHPEYDVRFFDSDVTVDFSKEDVPEYLGETWKKDEYLTEDRKRGSDLGQRSDKWQWRAPRFIATTSLDQTFPGWHELTTCYKNQGWKLISRKWHQGPEVEEGKRWEYIEARFEKATGEKGYLLFSHFDAFGEPVDAPAKWGSINSFFHRAKNRLANPLRANLFDGAVYQSQVFLAQYNDFDQELRDEVRDHYLEFREILREKFKEKRAADSKQ